MIILNTIRTNSALDTVEYKFDVIDNYYIDLYTMVEGGCSDSISKELVLKPTKYCLTKLVIVRVLTKMMESGVFIRRMEWKAGCWMNRISQDLNQLQGECMVYSIAY